MRSRRKHPRKDENSRNVPVGTLVRVRWGESGVSRRARLLSVEMDEQLRVGFEEDGSQACVTMDDMGKLEAFEASPAACSTDRLTEDSAKCREEGNILYRLGDAAAAAERYSVALEALGRVVASSGPNVVLAVHDKDIWSGTGNWPDSSADGILYFTHLVGGHHFDKFESENLAVEDVTMLVAVPERQFVRRDSVLAVRSERGLSDVQAALYLNRARCWLALGSPERAFQDCQLAAALRRVVTGRGRRGVAYCLSFFFVVLMLLCVYKHYFWMAIGFAAASFLTMWWARLVAKAFFDERLCAAIFLRAKAHLALGNADAARDDAEAAAQVAAPSQKAELDRLCKDIIAAVDAECEGRRPPDAIDKEELGWRAAALARIKRDAFAVGVPASYKLSEVRPWSGPVMAPGDRPSGVPPKPRGSD